MAELDMISNIDINNFFESMGQIFLMVIGLPIKVWNMIPYPIRIGIFVFIFFLAVLMAWVTWKYRDSWRYRS